MWRAERKRVRLVAMTTCHPRVCLVQDFVSSVALAERGVNRDAGCALRLGEGLGVGEQLVAVDWRQHNRFEDHRARAKRCDRSWREHVKHGDRRPVPSGNRNGVVELLPSGGSSTGESWKYRL